MKISASTAFSSFSLGKRSLVFGCLLFWGISQAQSVRIVAAGDIACDPEMVNTTIEGLCDSDVTADLIVSLEPDAVLALGDIQYEHAELDHFERVYDRTWGRFKNLTYPTPGNHEYYTDSSDYFAYFGAAAGENQQGYYSLSLGNWQLISLNSNCSFVACGADSAQAQWLRETLNSSPQTCTLAFWHHPRYSSGEHGDTATLSELWEILDAHGVELLLSGHDHHYERFAAQDAFGQVKTNGVRQFVVGTGGRSLYGVESVAANSEAVVDDSFGVLELSLNPETYSWRFVTPDGMFDEGRAECQK